MTDLLKAASMALNYIKDIRDHCAVEGIDCDKEDDLIEALRQALAQPEQMSEPIYLSGQYVGEGKVVSIKTGLPDGAIQEACHMAKLAQPEQESVALKQLRDLHKVQGSKGCYDVNEYMCGLYNGLELALSLFDDRKPEFKETN